MALKINENYKGIELTESYHRAQNIVVSMIRYKDQSTREENVILDTYNVTLPVTEAIYEELKKLDQFSDAVDC